MLKEELTVQIIALRVSSHTIISLIWLENWLATPKKIILVLREWKESINYTTATAKDANTCITVYLVKLKNRNTRLSVVKANNTTITNVTPFAKRVMIHIGNIQHLIFAVLKTVPKVSIIVMMYAHINHANTHSTKKP
jgi:hypothetical protein